MNSGKQSRFLAALTCMVGRFDIPDYDILSETLLINPNGGSVGVWAPAAFSMNQDASQLGFHHMTAIASRRAQTIGASIRAALESYAADENVDSSLVRFSPFSGDPAVRIGWSGPGRRRRAGDLRISTSGA